MYNVYMLQVEQYIVTFFVSTLDFFEPTAVVLSE